MTAPPAPTPPSHLSLNVWPTDEEVTAASACTKHLDAITNFLQGRGFTVHTGTSDSHDDFHHIGLVATGDTVVTLFQSAAFHQADWTLIAPPPAAPQGLRAELRLQLATMCRFENTPISLILESNTQWRSAITDALTHRWQHWLDTRLTEGHTPDSATMLLGLTIPPDEKALLTFDPAGRPTTPRP